jgi:hypothetical protein
MNKPNLQQVFMLKLFDRGQLSLDSSSANYQIESAELIVAVAKPYLF